MSAENFAVCFADMEAWEGWHKFSCNPDDPGGLTYSGVTQRAWAGWCAKKGRPVRDVRRASDDDLRALYREEYWTPARCDDLFPGLDLLQFDQAVNEGVREATECLQRGLRKVMPNIVLAVDGELGLETLGAVHQAKGRALEEQLIRETCAQRFAFWRGLRTFRIFGAGWMNRGEDIERRALGLLAASWTGAAA